MNKRLHAFILLTIASAIWGFGIPLIKKGYSQTTPMEFLFFRYFFAVLISLPLFFLQYKKVRCKLKQLPQLIGIGLITSVASHILLYGGLDKTSALETSLLTSLTPICIALGGWLFLREHIKRHEWVGIGIAFVGSVVIVIEPLLFGAAGFSLNHLSGNIMVLLNCLTWAAGMIWMKKIAKTYHPFTITIVSFLTAMVCFLLIVVAQNPAWQPLLLFSKPYGLAASLFQGILGSVLALYLYQRAQKDVAASEAGLFNYLIPLFSIPLAIIWLGELPSLLLLIGGIVIVGGIVIAEKK